MKKNYLIIIALIATLSFYSAKAADHMVMVGNNTFTPSNITNAVVGDRIVWMWQGGTHTTTSSTIPALADGWDEPITGSSQTYAYTITTPSTYTYFCQVHGTGMSGSFTATGSALGVTDLNVSTVSQASPNPFQNKITVSYKNAERLSLYNVTGRLIKTVELSKIDEKTELDLSSLPSGVYFYNLINEGRIEETKRLIKWE